MGTRPSAPAVLFAGRPRDVDVDVVIPVCNEQAELGSSVVLLTEQLTSIAARDMAFTWKIVVADNASDDRTWDVARSLAARSPACVRALRIARRGRGRALRSAWSTSRARVLAYMDVDLSTDIRQIPELIGPILEGTADVSFGSRLLPGSSVVRCARRELISRTYNAMLRAYLGVGFHDAQCGFKALSADAARVLLPLVSDEEWFFDTELLVCAERLGVAMSEFPVAWREDPGSTVRVLDTIAKDLAGMRRLKRRALAAPPLAGAARRLETLTARAEPCGTRREEDAR